MNNGEDAEFVWASEQIENASEDELVEHICDLQDELQTVQQEVDELRDTLFLLLSLQADALPPSIQRD